MAATVSPQAFRRLGKVLIDRGLITRDQLWIALHEQQKTKERLDFILVKLGMVPGTVMNSVLATALGEKIASPVSPAGSAAVPQAAKPHRRLGDLLLDGDIITKDQLRIAIHEQKKTKGKLGNIFVQLGLVPEDMMRSILGAALGEDSLDLDKIKINPEAVKMIPQKMADRYRIIPVDWDERLSVLTVAMADTLDVAVLDMILAKLPLGTTIRTVLAGDIAIGRAIDKFYGSVLSLEGIMREIETGEVDLASVEFVEKGAFSHPMVRLVDSLLADAVRRDVSDIHIEPEYGFVRVRYRIDGVLIPVRSFHRDYLSGLVVRIKVLSGMNIAETRVPQDGRFTFVMSKRDIDFRVSAQPTTHGENLVLRILDRNKGIVSLDNLGLAQETLMTLNLMMARPEGIILVTGPTGSGKTTTLYSMLNFLNTEDVNIMTLEDPVEYPMQMVRQTTVNYAANLDFSSGIRSMLRQDPDIILVGEIRDKETAQMALRAAMTGHKVFTTLHTNSALGAFSRLLDMEVTPDVLSGNIIGIMAQRLVRKLCPKCKKPARLSPVEGHLLGIEPGADVVTYEAVGCEACFNIGHKGRMTTMEVLRMDSDFDDLISRHGTHNDFVRLAAEKGFRTLAQDGVRLVLEGLISISEMSRVLDLSAHFSA